MTRAIVSDRIRITASAVPLACATEMREVCQHPNPRRLGARLAGSRWWHKIPEFVPTWREEGVWLSFPRGAWCRLRGVLARHGVSVELDDQRSMGDARMQHMAALDPAIVLRPYQERMIEAAITVENCVLRAPTGSGKSVTCMGLIAQLALPSIVITPTSGIMRQWRREVALKLGLRERDVGAIGGGKWDVKPITVALYHTLAERKCDGLRDVFGLQVFDEVQDAGADRAFGVADALAARYRIGVSAWEKRKDRLQKVVYDAFGEIACEVTDAEVEDAHGTVPVYGIVYPTAFRADWYAPSGAAIEARAMASGKDASSFDDSFVRLLDEMGRDAGRTAQVVAIVEKQLARGGVVVVLTRRHDHVERIRAQLRAMGHEVGFLAGGNAKEFDRTVADLCDGHLKCAVGTVEAFGKGMDVPPITDVVMAMPVASNVSMLKQAKGRACRPHPASGKREARFHYLFDERVFPEEHERAVKAMFKGRYEKRAA